MRYLLTGILLIIVFEGSCQNTLTATRTDFGNHQIDRLYHIGKDTASLLFSSWKPYQNREVARLIEKKATENKFTSYLYKDYWEYLEGVSFTSRKPLFKKLYLSEDNFFHHHGEGIRINVNPLLHFQLGNDSQTGSPLYINRRGLMIEGLIDEKLSFQTTLTENQVRLPSYVREFQQEFGVIPGIGFWKLLGDDAYDFLFASGHIDFQATKHISLQLGHDRFFIGNGSRSLFLSDFSNNYPYFKIKTKIWKFQYTNLYAQLTADVNSFDGGTFGTGEFPKKFMTLHHLSLDVSKKVTIGLFESVIFSRQDSIGNNQFEFAYLNPVIFYRAAEQQTGSPDNALLGAEINWKVVNKASLYGQFVIDEFIISNVFGNRGSWSNKYAYQVGLKYFDVLGINRLDLQVEHNFGRPYSYSHTTQTTSYSHYEQPLAHPLGANFTELLAIVRYRPLPKLYFYGKLLTAEYGEDTETSNVGKNILLPNPSRDSDEGNFVGQGINTKLLFAELRVSYMLKHNLFIDLSQIVRREDSEIDDRNLNNAITTVGIRLNLASGDYTF
ncbi:MAG: hypothetical protein WBA74_17575 [Cyclobacteriaceae bacterium]